MLDDVNAIISLGNGCDRFRLSRAHEKVFNFTLRPIVERLIKHNYEKHEVNFAICRSPPLDGQVLFSSR
jgi:hypothetical protein